jgi:hypothetical protein
VAAIPSASGAFTELLPWEEIMAWRGGGVFPSAALFIGLLGLFELIGKPRFQAYRTVDMVQLFASGMCFGICLMWLIERLRNKPAA